MICPNCHRENRDTAKFCDECGRPFAREEQDKITSEQEKADQTSPDASKVPASLPSDSTGNDETSEGLSVSDLIEEAALLERAVLEGTDGSSTPDAEKSEQAATSSPGLSGASLEPCRCSGKPASEEEKDAKSESLEVSDSSSDASTSISENASDEASEASVEAPGTQEISSVVPEEPSLGDASKTSELNSSDLKDYIPLKAREADAQRPKIDLSGLDECLVDSTYRPPKSAWRSGDTMEMPPLEGSSASSAKAFRAADPSKKKTHRKAAAIAIGGVLAIAAAAVLVTYSLELWGGKVVPNVVGKTQTDAQYLLEEKSFEVDVREVPSDDTEGIVLSVTPSPGGRVNEDQRVIVNVSVPRLIPEAVGLQRDVVIRALQDQGISNITIASEPSDQHVGTVVAIDPLPNTRVLSTDKVVVTVAEPFCVPDVVGKKSAVAVRELEDAGYIPVITYDTHDSNENDIVLSTRPKADAELALGETVEVVVSLSRGATLVDVATGFLEGLQESGEALHATNNGKYYGIRSVDKVDYAGDDTTSFTITAVEGASAALAADDSGEQAALAYEGTIVWDSSNYVVSVDIRE